MRFSICVKEKVATTTTTSKNSLTLPLFRHRKLYRVKKIASSAAKPTSFINWQDRKHTQLEKRDDSWA